GSGRLLRADRDRALLPGRPHEAVPVGGEAPDGHEQGAGTRAARVVGHLGDEQAGIAREDGAGQAGHQVAEGHGAVPPEERVSRASVSTQGLPASISVPGARLWATTRPEPTSSTIKPRRAAAMAASRAGWPRRSGMIPGSRARSGRGVGAGAGRQAARTIPSTGSATARRTRPGSSGGTASWRRAASAMRAKRGAATSPPWFFGPRGESREARISRAGCETGAKPTKDATWSAIE